MRCHKPGRAAAALLFSALCALHAVDAAAHGVSLHFHHPLPADAAFHRDGLAPWAQKVESDAGARIRFHLHPASTFGGPADALYDQARDGNADVVWGPVRAAPDHLPALALFGWPLQVRSAAGASRALFEYARVNDLFDRDFDGTRVIATHVSEPAQIHWVKAPETAGVRDRRIGTSSESDVAVLTRLGARVSVLAAARMADALKAGEVDAVVLPWSQLGGVGVDTIARAHTELGAGLPGLGATVYVFAMNTSSYRGLADDLRAVVSANSGEDLSSALGRLMDQQGARARKAALDRGDPIAVMSAEERKAWEDAARDAIEAQVTALERAGVKAKPLLESARDQLRTHDRAPK